MMMSTGAFFRASVAQSPPKPEPMITTRCLLDVRSTGDGVAGLGAGVSTVMTHSSLWPMRAPRTATHLTAETRATGFIMPPLLSNRPSDSPNWPPFATRSARAGPLAQPRDGRIGALAADAVARSARDLAAARSASGTTVVDNTIIE